MLTKEWIYSFKRTAKVLIDACLFAISITLAYKLRIEHNLTTPSQDWYWNTQLPFIVSVTVAIRISFLFLFKAYSRMWRYTEINEVLELVKPILFSSLILSIPRLIGYSSKTEIFAIPYGVIIIDSCLSLILLSFARVTRKLQIYNRNIRKRSHSNEQKNKKRTLIIGAGTGSYELCRKVLEHPELNLEIICALDDDSRKHGTTITSNINVVGNITSIKEIVEEKNIEQVIIAIPSLSPSKLREIISLCNELKVETQIIPGVDQLAGGKVSIEQIRKVSLEDLLGREPVDLSLPEVASFINNKKILITGAGGSIGSELTKQLVTKFKPKEIFILGRGENSIFNLILELSRTSLIKITPVICDVRNYPQLYKHISEKNPDVIFHVAAHKHVPLMEDHPIEAFENNTLGTKNIAEIAGKIKVKTFVNISTDKAVNPINVLGCTKRLAELIVSCFSIEFSDTKYVSVRFGNVIGSRGSVIPIWENQIKNNLPITVTSKDAYRFFMTISEAAQLVIKAGAIGKPSEIMVLDMGEEVNIYQLAKDFIKLSGFNNSDISIEVTGLRPGEKLKEELLGYYEGANSTKHKKILVIEPTKISTEDVKSSMKHLEEISEYEKTESFRKSLVIEVNKLNDLDKKGIEVKV